MGRTQRQLADQISRDLGIPTRTGQRFLQQLIDLVANDLVTTRRVELRGLGTFAVCHRPQKQTIHPQTKKPITIPACDTVQYRSSIALRKRLRQNPLPPPPPPEQPKPKAVARAKKGIHAK